ncbi:MAG: Gfo/Idh/MocA family oxidoreductase [Acidobacteriota bacterium]
MNRREFMKQSTLAGATAALGPNVLGKPSAGRVAPNDRITIGVIGSGARAQQLMEAALTLPQAEIVAVSDVYTGRAERAKARTGGRATIYKDYHEILQNKDIDTVFIGTPDHWHKQMAMEALQAGKDIYLEKPMTYSVDEGLEIMDAVKKTGRILQVGSQGMSTATQQMAREMVKAGKLGQITMIRASYNRNSASGAWIYPIPPDANEKTVDWKAFLGPAPDRPFDLERFFRWRCYWDYSGGIATDLFVHLVTSIHYIMDAKMPQSVTATGELYRWKESREVPDTINGILVYPEEGFTVNLSSTFNNQSSSESGFEVLGTEGSIAFRGGSLTFADENVYEDNRWVVASWDEELEQAYYNDPKIEAIETPSTWEPQMKEGSRVWTEWGKDATITHIQYFLEAVESRKPPVQDALMGHRAASCAHMVNQSLREMKTFHWDAAREKVKA